MPTHSRQCEVPVMCCSSARADEALRIPSCSLQAELVADLRLLCIVSQDPSSGQHARTEPRRIMLAMRHNNTCFWSASVRNERWEACGAGRVHLQVQDVSCIAELAHELTTIVRLHHQFKWFHSGTPLLSPAAAAPHATLLHWDCRCSRLALCYLP